MAKGPEAFRSISEASGELGVAVQSHWFGVGGVVAWARAEPARAALRGSLVMKHCWEQSFSARNSAMPPE